MSLTRQELMLSRGPVELVARGLDDARPALLLVHGAGCNHRFWDELGAALDDWPLVAPSLPGRLGSSGAPLPTVSAMAAWLAELIATLGRPHLVLGGHSMGSGVVLELCLEHRGAFASELRGLVLLGAAGMHAVKPELLRSLRAAVESGAAPDAGAAMYHPDTPRQLVAAAETRRAATPFHTMLSDWYAINHFDRCTHLGRITTPALVIAGADDRVTLPAEAAALAAHLANAELTTLPRAGHLFPVEHAAEVARRLLPFLRRVGGSR